MVSSYSCNTKPFANKPQGDFIKTNLNNFLPSISGLETRIPTLLLTQLLCLCLHFTAKTLAQGGSPAMEVSGKGVFVSEALRSCPSRCLPVCAGQGLHGHRVEGVDSRIGSAQLIVCMLEWCYLVISILQHVLQSVCSNTLITPHMAN